ncbi:MAG: hypothetical protein U9Q73_02820 [Nanoarchaeota archaeon]|nr:hypothetical protein [Nanoarchaeota archaeon]
MLKNNKIKKRKIGSEVTIHRRGKCNGLNISPTPDDQKPTSQIGSGSNPGGAIDSNLVFDTLTNI